MNILASYKWIKEYVHTQATPQEMAEKLSLSGPSVEQTIDLAEQLRGVVVGKIELIKDHPNADKLKVLEVSIGQGDSLREVVCGGVNCKEGMLVAFADVGVKVNWHGEGEWHVLEPATIRGVASHGMVCASVELGFPQQEGDKEIWDLSYTNVDPGTSLAEALAYDDQLFDVEITTNRPDWIGMRNFSREVGAIMETPASLEDHVVQIPTQDADILHVENKATDRSHEYNALVIDGVSVVGAETPVWMASRLWMAGIKTINIIVDITNYVMLEYGQPLHAFDYTKISGSSIVVRMANDGEMFSALDNNEYQLQETDLVIADAEKTIALAGIIGGFDSGVTENTERIVLEAAHFEPVGVRRSARAHGIATLSSQYFEKNIPREAAQKAMHRAAQLIVELAGGHIVSTLHTDGLPERTMPVVQLDLRHVSERIGVSVDDALSIAILERLGFSVHDNGDRIVDVTIPWWRSNDIEGWHDLIEEIARLYGYHNLPSVLPSGNLPSGVDDNRLYYETKIKELLAGMGATELYTYSFVSPQALSLLGLSDDDALKLLNPLTDVHVYMRPSLIPSVLEVVADNQTLVDDIFMFELSAIYEKQGLEELPNEKQRLLVALAVEKKDVEVNFYRSKGILEQLCSALHIDNWTLQAGLETDYYINGKCATILIGGDEVGTIGVLNRMFKDSMKIKRDLVLVDIDVEAIIRHASKVPTYVPASEYPSVNIDVSVVAPDGLEWLQLAEAAQKIGGDLMQRISLFDIYRGGNVQDGKKSLAFSLQYGSQDRTLTMDEANELTKKIMEHLSSKLSVEWRK